VNGLHCAFTGRVGQDPEKRYTRAGKAMLVFSVAHTSGARGVSIMPPL
jgi:hypothetical protein